MIKQRQLNIQRTPLPIESVFFQEDVATNTEMINDKPNKVPIQDPVHWNRYYFDYPPEWVTSDTGEDIVGVRSLWLLNKQRHIKFTLFIRKYGKDHFRNAYNSAHNVNFPIDTIDMLHLSDERIDDIVQRMSGMYISICSIPVDVIIEHDEDFRKIGDYIESHLTKFIEQMNASNSGVVFHYNPKFVQESMNFKYGNRNRDIAFDTEYADYYDKTFKIVFGSPRNTNKYSTEQNDKDLDCYVDFAIMKSDQTLNKRYNEKYQLRGPNDRQMFDEFDWLDDDTREVFNIEADEPQPYHNPFSYFAQFHRQLEIKNLWDRHTCKVFASFANQSNHYYVGNSHVLFTPIKYYKLNSRDNRFWIEFYSARNPNIPIRIPNYEGFVLEMQFMQNDKLLYV